MNEATDFEALLRRALAPIEPPIDLEQRLESTLEQMTAAAVDELESWEIEAIADPRNWARLAYAGGVVVAGAGAATGLVLLRARQKAKQKNPVRRALRR
jgi:serine/threonine protein kinase HipA of HipAB toxin-antitoxin module